MKTHERANKIFNKLHLFKEISEYDSRLLELINYFGWEIGHKAHFCRAFYFDEYEKSMYENAKEKLGVSDLEYRIMHQYAYFNRLSPERSDLFYIYDYILEKLDEIKKENSLADLDIIDFGCGLGQIGLAFALDGHKTLFVDIVEKYLDFAKYLCQNRGIDQNKTKFILVDPKDVYVIKNQAVLIIEWSSFEHISDPMGQLIELEKGLIKGGMIVTTSLKKSWDRETIEHYRKDGGEEIFEKLNSSEINKFIDDNFEVIVFEKSLARILIKK